MDGRMVVPRWNALNRNSSTSVAFSRARASRLAAVGCCLLLVSSLNAQADDETKQRAEREFGPPAVQSEWLKSPPLPEWTEKSRFVENQVEHLVAGTAPVLSAAEAEAELDREMQRVVREWIRERFSPEVADHIEIPASKIRREWMVNHLPVPCMLELPSDAPNHSYPMYRSFAQIAMTDHVVDQVSSLWATKQVELLEARQRWTLTRWSVIGGALLLLLASVHSYLRMDFTTRGFHTWRLRLLLGLAATGIVGMSIWLLNVLN